MTALDIQSHFDHERVIVERHPEACSQPAASTCSPRAARARIRAAGRE